MPTTSAAAAWTVLEALDAAGVEYALLHGAADFETDSISDVDLAVASLDEDTARRLVHEANARGYWLIVTWRYDIRGLVAFFVSDDFSEGVHLDLLIDPLGRSRYGLKTAEVVRKATVREGIRQADPLDSWLYQLSKRWMKGQHSQLQQLIAESPVNESTSRARAHQLFRLDRVEQISRLVSGLRPRTRHVVAWHARNIARIVARARRPCGVWLHVGEVHSRDYAHQIAEQLSLVLVRATSTEVGRVNVARRLGLTGAHGTDRWRASASVIFGAPPLLRSCVRLDQNAEKSFQRDQSCFALFRLTQLVQNDLRKRSALLAWSRQ